MESRDVKLYPIKVNGTNIGVVMTNAAWDCNKTSDNPVMVVFTPRLIVSLLRVNLPYTLTNDDHNVRSFTNTTSVGPLRHQSTPDMRNLMALNAHPTRDTTVPQLITPEALDGALRNATSTSTRTTIIAAKRRSLRPGVKKEYTEDSSEDERPPTKQRQLFINKRTSRLVDKPISTAGKRLKNRNHRNKKTRKEQIGMMTPLKALMRNLRGNSVTHADIDETTMTLRMVIKESLVSKQFLIDAPELRAIN